MSPRVVGSWTYVGLRQDADEVSYDLPRRPGRHAAVLERSRAREGMWEMGGHLRPECKSGQVRLSTHRTNGRINEQGLCVQAEANCSQTARTRLCTIREIESDDELWLVWRNVSRCCWHGRLRTVVSGSLGRDGKCRVGRNVCGGKGGGKVLQSSRCVC